MNYVPPDREGASRRIEHIQFTRRGWWNLIIIMSLVAVWGIVDVIRGDSTPEILVFTIPMLAACIWRAVLLLRAPQSATNATISPASDPTVVSNRVRQIKILALTTVAVLFAIATLMSIIRSGTFWRNTLMGVGALALAWSIIILLMRPKAQR